MTKSNMDIKYLLLSLLIGIITLSTLDSCYKERLKIHKFSGGSWNPEMAVPLFFGKLDMQMVVDRGEDYWYEDPNGLLSIVYRSEQITQVGNNVIDIPDQQFDSTVSLLLPIGLPTGDSALYLFQLNAKFAPPTNERFDSILVKEGDFIIEVSTDINHDSYVELIIPDFTRYGVPLKQKIDLPYNGSSPTSVTKTISLADYWVKINTNGDIDNKVSEFINVLVKKGNQADNSPYSISLSQEIKNITYYQLFGYFDQYTVDIDLQKIDISMFNHSAIFDASLEEAMLKLNFSNSFGIPVDITFDSLYVEKDGVIKDITSNLLPTFSINYPDINNVGYSDSTIIIFNQDNSNIVDVINFFPQKFFYSGSSTANPLGDIIPNFVIDTSKISIQTEVEIPLYGRYIVYELTDTTTINLENEYNWDEINSIDVNFNTVNHFPFDASMQIYLTDTNYIVIDSLFSDIVPLTEAAIPGPPPDYRVSIPEYYTVTASITNQRLQNLKYAAHMIVSGKSSTYDSGTKVVKIYSDYSLDFQVSMKVNYNTDF